MYAEGGRYAMNLRTDGHAVLSLDGAVVLNLCGNAPYPNDLPPFGGDPGQTAFVTLAAGWHRVRLD